MSSKKRSSFSKDGIGLFVLVLSLKLFVGINMQGCGVKTKTLAKISHSAITISKNYENLCCISLLILFMYASQTYSRLSDSD
jgi:hypothetical protein